MSDSSTHRKCPWCGRLVIIDDAACAVLHEEPECSRFTAACASVGKQKVERVTEDRIAAHLHKLAADRRSERS